MSLIHRAHVIFAAAFGMAILGPWSIAQVDPVDGDAGWLPLPSAGGLPPPPTLPETALTGRLFFVPLAEPTATAAAPDASVPAIAPPPTLVGTAVSRRGRAAAVLRGQSGEVRLVAAGETVDGWVVARIGDGTVAIRQAGQTQQLTLPRATAVAPPAPSDRGAANR